MTTKQPLPVLPGPDCATIAPLLPLLDSHDLSGEDIARVREHLNTCDWCAREYAAHAIVGAALRRHYGGPSQGASPYLSMERIVNDYETQDPSTRLSTAYAPTTAPGTPPNLPRRSPSRLTGIVAVAAALLLVGLAATLFTMFTRTSSGPANKGNGTPTMTSISHQPPTPLHLPAGANLMAVSMASPTDGWALGMTADRQHVLLLRYHDGQWAIWPGALPQLQLLLSVNSISMASPTDGWITGIGGFLHYSNNQWVAVSVPGIGAIEMVKMVSPTDGWARAFIQSADKQNGVEGLLHYSNGAWSVVAAPAALNTRSAAIAFDFAVTPAGECWLMYRNSNTGDTTILRYAGGAFQVAYTLTGVQGQTITMRSSQDGWLTGTDASGKVVYHFDGSAWAKVAIPANFKQQPYLYRVVISPSGEAWLLAGAAGDGGLAAHYRDGTWEMVSVQSTVDVTTFALVAADEGWATGHAGGTAVLYHYQNGSWTQYPS
jgi:anti-sigma factor RsiW